MHAACLLLRSVTHTHIFSILVSCAASTIAKHIDKFLGLTARQTLEEYPKRAAFCVPIIINAINAFDVSKRPTPEMEQEGKKPGTNLADKLLNEPNMPTRCCVVLRVFGDGVAWMQKKLEA